MPKKGRKPYARTTFDGFVVDRRTRSALRWVDAQLRDRTGARVQLAQGSYNAGGVSASAGTHDSGGVVDVRVTPLSEEQRTLVLRLLKRAGFAAWARPNTPGLWGPHIHAVMIQHKRIAPAAAAQVLDYDAHRDGLASHHHDGSYRPDPPVRWSHKRKRPVPRD